MSWQDSELPNSKESEYAALAAVLLTNGDAMAVLEPVLDPTDFYTPYCSSLYRTFLDMTRQNIPLEAPLIIEHMRKEGNHDAARFGEILSFIPDTKSIPHYVDVIKDASQKRWLLRTLAASQDAIRTPSKSAEIATTLTEKLAQITSDIQSSAYSVDKIVRGSMAASEIRAGSGRPLVGYRCGIDKLDGMLSGFQRGKTYLITGYTGAGKTALATNLVYGLMKYDDCRVIWYSLEMSRDSLGNRLLARASGVPLPIIQSGLVSDAQETELFKSVTFWKDLAPRLAAYDDMTTYDAVLSDIRNRARHSKTDLFIIDYIQLIEGGPKSRNREEELNSFSKALTMIAKDFNVAIISFAQSHAPESGKRPTLSDIRECRALANHSRAVIMLHRPSCHDKSEPECKVWLQVEKQNDGPMGDILMHFDGERMRFMEGDCPSTCRASAMITLPSSPRRSAGLFQFVE